MLNDFNDLIRVASTRKNLCEGDYLSLIPYIAHKEMEVNDNDVRALIKLISNLFKQAALDAKFDEKKIRAIMTKFRDAGRRSAPWKPTSSKVPIDDLKMEKMGIELHDGYLMYSISFMQQKF